MPEFTITLRTHAILAGSLVVRANDSEDAQQQLLLRSKDIRWDIVDLDLAEPTAVQSIQASPPPSPGSWQCPGCGASHSDPVSPRIRYTWDAATLDEDVVITDDRYWGSEPAVARESYACDACGQIFAMDDHPPILLTAL